MSRSLRRQLQWWTVLLLLGVGLTTTLASFLLARQEADTFLDQQLVQVAHELGKPATVWTDSPLPHGDFDPEDDFLIQVWTPGGQLLHRSNPEAYMPPPGAAGFLDYSAGDSDYHMYTLVAPDHTVQVAQHYEVREEMAFEAAARAMLPLLTAIPLVAVMIWFAIGRAMRGLDAITAAASQRHIGSMAPLPVDKVPQEIRPLVDSINDLLARLAEALRQQKQFIADAAHELRTPLMALRLQVDNLKAHASPAQGPALAQLDAGMGRITHLVQQLLALAREDSRAMELPVHGPVALHEVLQNSISTLLPLADARGIDLGMEHNRVLSVHGSAAGLQALFEVFIDNALRYIPAGGRVDLSSRQQAGGEVIIDIRDNGPGIPEAELGRVFERFYRADRSDPHGSGLGLAIARQIAGQHGADIRLGNRSDGQGLWVSVVFPAPGAAV